MSFRLPPYELRRTISDRIHDEIKTRLASFDYAEVEWREGLRRTLANQTLSPKTLLVRSQSRGFSVAEHNKLCGGPVQEIENWVWQAYMQFDRQVSLDELETDLMHNPIVIARDDELPRQISVFLLDATDSNPPEQGSAQGTRVTYRFQADLSPL